MGVDRVAYMGPYLRISTRPKLERVDVCGHTVDGSAFCPECGCRQVERYKMKAVGPDIHEVLNGLWPHLEQVFEDRDTVCVGPNRENWCGRNLGFNLRCEGGEVAVQDKTIAREREAFESEFAEQIRTIKEHDPTAEVRWGLLGWIF